MANGNGGNGSGQNLIMGKPAPGTDPNDPIVQSGGVIRSQEQLQELMNAQGNQGTQTNTSGLPRFDIPGAGETPQLDPDMITAGDATKADVETLAPPQDIDAATIEDYTPYTEELGTVDPESTVEGRLAGLLSQNNPYIDRARTEAAQLANRRGMLNTSMAAGAAEGAAIDRALPIAQQDARAHLEQQFLNQGYSNEAAKHLADASIQRENLEAGFRQDTSQFNARQQFERDQLQFAAENRANELFAAEQNKNNFAQLSADLQAQLKGIDNDMAMRLETLTREYGLLENMDSINGSIYQQMVQEMGTILANADKVSEATGKINALIEAAGVEFSFSSSMTGGGGGPGGLGGSGGGLSTIKSGDIRPPKPGKDYYWSDKEWRWKKRHVREPGEGGSCFVADTKVTMFDGTEKNIQDVQIGDAVLGAEGEKNIVMEYDYVTVGRRHGKVRKVIAFNGGKPFTTEDHPFMSSKGWRCLDPAHAREETPGLEVSKMKVGDYLEMIGDPLYELKSIEYHDFDEETPLYNFFLNGNRSYYADGFLVHNKGGDNGGPSGGGNGSGGGSGGCFSGEACFRMADGSWKQIQSLEVGDQTKGGVVTAVRKGPSKRQWFDYMGTRVTDEHFVFEHGVWKYVKDAVLAKPIEPVDTFYTVDTTEHRLYGINGTVFSDDAVFDADHYTHEMDYGKEQWDLQLIELNREEWGQVG